MEKEVYNLLRYLFIFMTFRVDFCFPTRCRLRLIGENAAGAFISVFFVCFFPLKQLFSFFSFKKYWEGRNQIKGIKIHRYNFLFRIGHGSTVIREFRVFPAITYSVSSLFGLTVITSILRPLVRQSFTRKPGPGRRSPL